MEHREKVSLIIPTYNEEKYIGSVIDSIYLQDYPKELMEVIFVDGMSVDGTRDIILQSDLDDIMNVKVLDNPRKTAPCAVNIGIMASTGDYIIRMDAHSEYYSDYVRKCVETLHTVDADNAGGIIITENKGYIGKANSLVVSSKFGVGNSGFRTNGDSGFVDTVPFGAFPRKTFEKYGLFDERLARNEDNEMNYRIRSNGGKVYMNRDIKAVYHNRDSVSGLLKMAFSNGRWNIYTFFLCPGAMSLRHFIPFIFVLSLIILPFLACLPSVTGMAVKILFMTEIFIYILLDIIFSVMQSGRNGVRFFPALIFLYPCFHIVYGMGSVVGIIKMGITGGRSR